MGMYNTYGSVQLKVGALTLREYKIGDEVDIPDGIYCGREGLVVVKDGIFIVEFPALFSKWGGIISPGSILFP